MQYLSHFNGLGRSKLKLTPRPQFNSYVNKKKRYSFSSSSSKNNPDYQLMLHYTDLLPADRRSTQGKTLSNFDSRLSESTIKVDRLVQGLPVLTEARSKST